MSKEENLQPPEDSFWEKLEETQKMQDEIIRQSGDNPDNLPAVSDPHKAAETPASGGRHGAGSPGAAGLESYNAGRAGSPLSDADLMPQTGSPENPREYYHDSVAFHELKRKFGIRNRFWRKSYKRLKPGLNRLYDEALVSRYRPLTQAVLESLEIKDPAARKEFFAREFTELLQRGRRLGPLYLQPDQIAQMPRKPKAGGGPAILKADGSPDLELREQVLAYFEKGIELLDQELSADAVQSRLKEMIAKFEEPPEGAPISKMMNSTWMQVLSSLVPGFPLIGVILTEMDGQKELDWKKMGNRLLGRAAREGANLGLKRALRSLRAPGAFLPVSFLLEQGMNRSELLGYLALRVERKRKQLLDIAGPANRGKKHL